MPRCSRVTQGSRMKTTEPGLQLKSPIQKNYNRAVFYTYIGVIIMALLTAWFFFEREKSELLEQREEQIELLQNTIKFQ